MGEHRLQQLADRTGLRLDVIGDLLDKGWTFVDKADGPAKWVSPLARVPNYHEECKDG